MFSGSDLGRLRFRLGFGVSRGQKNVETPGVAFPGGRVSALETIRAGSFCPRPLARWLGPLKGFTANQAKKALGLRDSAFWQNESYDHLVRSDEEFRRVQRYIELNPVKAGFVQKPEQFQWSSAGAAYVTNF